MFLTAIILFSNKQTKQKGKNTRLEKHVNLFMPKKIQIWQLFAYSKL